MSATHTLIVRATADARRALLEHPLYQRLSTAEHLRLFMQHHVFAVWDFMSLLKALQRELTCVQIPWLPSGDARMCRLVNEIVLGEESDVAANGAVTSHFELYLQAMTEAGANLQPIQQFIASLRSGTGISAALDQAPVPECVKAFVHHTFQVIANGQPHAMAAAFTYGREDLIPDMFSALVAQLQSEAPGQLDTFRYYLDRHIALDGEEHGNLAREMVAALCGDDAIKQAEAAAAANDALQMRLTLWDSIAEAVALQQGG